MTGKPKIVSEKKRERHEAKPPTSFLLHDWGKPYMGIDVYISKDSGEKILEHCLEFAEQRLEAMGFLIGDVYTWKGKEYTVIKDAITTELDTTSVSVRFKRDAFEELFRKLDSLDYDYLLVGWYHSHPGHACFLSTTDINTQKKMFNKPYHIALVVDPMNQEMKAYKLTQTHYEEKVFAIYGENLDNFPSHKMAVEHIEPVPMRELEMEVDEIEDMAEVYEKKGYGGKFEKVRANRPKKTIGAPSPLYFLWPIVGGIFGGIAGYFMLWKRDKNVAEGMIIVGALMGIIWFIAADYFSLF